MSSLAVTVVGHDRPGIVAQVTAAIAELGGNLEDSSMTLLRGHFAMTLVASLPDAGPEELARLLQPLQDDGLTVAVLTLPPDRPAPPGTLALLSVHGADRPGIVSTATGVLAAFDGNITDLATRLGRELYVLTADVTFPLGTDIAAVAAALALAMEPLDVVATLRPVDEDVL
jgi:glycine cleavage system transcriptional repressor